MTKYTLTVHVDVYAATPLEGALSAADKLFDMGAYVHQVPADVFSRMPLPTGGITGTAHTEEKLGWLGVFSFGEKE